jgi:hypothetical protein
MRARGSMAPVFPTRGIVFREPPDKDGSVLRAHMRTAKAVQTRADVPLMPCLSVQCQLGLSSGYRLRFPTPRAGRSRRHHIQGKHQVLHLMEENGHLVALGLGFDRLHTVPILRMVRASVDRLGLPSAVVTAHGCAIGGRISALVTARLALRCAALGLTRDDVR